MTTAGNGPDDASRLPPPRAEQPEPGPATAPSEPATPDEPVAPDHAPTPEPTAAVPQGLEPEAPDPPGGAAPVEASEPPEQEPGPPESPPAEPAPEPGLPHPQPLAPAPAIVLTMLVTLVFLMFLLTEPTQRWIALVGVVAAALGTDGVLRSARGEAFALGLDTTPQLFLPALYALALPVFIEHNARGLWVPVSGLAAGVGFGAILLAEIHSVRPYEERFSLARVVAGGAAYLTAFAFLSLSYTFELELAAAIAAAALVAGLLSIELLRDATPDPLDTLLFAAVGALIVGELRWALHFVPLDGHLAALTLVLALFFSSGVLYSHLTRQLTRAVLAEYVAVVAAGVALVVLARATDLA